MAMTDTADDPHTAVLAEINALLDDAQALGMLGLPLAELETFTCDVLRIKERATALAAATVAEADAAAMAVRNGHKSLNAHLADKTGMAAASIAPLRTIGNWLHRFPVFMTAWLTGAISDAHVRELKRLDNSRTHFSLRRDQLLLIDASQTLEFSAWVDALAYWLLHADPDGSLTPERDAAYGVSFTEKKNGDIAVVAKTLAGPAHGPATTTGHECQTTNNQPRTRRPTVHRRSKQALLVEARGKCRTRGCDAPFAWLEADHIVAHSKGGATDTANGQIKCAADNRRKGSR